MFPKTFKMPVITKWISSAHGADAVLIRHDRVPVTGHALDPADP
jgi:hypothetical protein